MELEKPPVVRPIAREGARWRPPPRAEDEALQVDTLGRFRRS